MSERGRPAEIIDMPMRTLGNMDVMTDPRPHSARSQGTADVDIAARLNGKLAQPPNPDGPPLVGSQEEGIAAGLRVHSGGYLY